MMTNYLKETKLLDYSNQNIQQLVATNGWLQMNKVTRVKNIYNYVRDEVLFGYNIADEIPASQVLADGYGQCNTKSTLLMALLRAADIPNRIHGFTIDKELQKGAISGVWYWLAPQELLHTWVEIFVNDSWYFLEGVILDKSYLSKLQKLNSECKTTFCGYGVYTDNFENPPIDWDLNNTYIQEKGINQDFGVFDTPDKFYAQHQQKMGAVKKFIFENFARKNMNANILRIRNGDV